MGHEHFAWFANYLKEAYQTPILENFLGLKIVDVKKGYFIISAKITDMHSNLYGAVHGGILASITDVAMGGACISLKKRITTIDQNINYIKPAPVGSTLTAIGTLISNGNSIMRAAAEVFDEQQQLIVRSQGSYFIIGNFSKDDHPKRQLLKK